MRYLKTICAVCCTLISTIAFAHDFSIKSKDGQVLYFNITNSKTNTVEVTYEGRIASKNLANYQGEITIPSQVRYNNQLYRVTGIDDKAFSCANKLTGVVMPSGIESIGNFAFEKCANLSKIIFSGTNSKMGEGVFFGCTSISNVSFGSDWVTLNLKMFMWSNSLKSITIPAKVKTIQNLKSLSSLEEILVDVNNANFSSDGTLLYSKDGKMLLGCARAYAGNLKVASGVESIYYGALLDCPNIKKIDLPASLSKLSYLEFSRMKNLRQVIMRNPEAIYTATVGGKRVFALKVADRDNCQLIMPKTAVRKYNALLSSKGGEYSAVADMPANTPNVPMVSKESELIGTKQIRATKKFTKYE